MSHIVTHLRGLVDGSDERPNESTHRGSQNAPGGRIMDQSAMKPRISHGWLVCLAVVALNGQVPSERGRLIGLQREAAALVARAARADASGDEIRQALVEASARFEALAGESSSAPPSAAQAAALVPPAGASSAIASAPTPACVRRS